MKDYLFIFCSADGETLRKYVEAKDIKTAWIRAAGSPLITTATL